MLPCTRGYAASPRGKDSQLPIADCHRAIHKFVATVTNLLIIIYKNYCTCWGRGYVSVILGIAALYVVDCASLRAMGKCAKTRALHAACCCVAGT